MERIKVQVSYLPCVRLGFQHPQIIVTRAAAAMVYLGRTQLSGI